MNEYRVKMLPKAGRDLEEIYEYIIAEFSQSEVAERIADQIEAAILGLEIMPYRGALRKTGRYAYQGYRQLFVRNYTIVYYVEEKEKIVVIITIQYTPRRF